MNKKEHDTAQELLECRDEWIRGISSDSLWFGSALVKPFVDYIAYRIGIDKEKLVEEYDKEAITALMSTELSEASEQKLKSHLESIRTSLEEWTDMDLRINQNKKEK